MKAKSRSSGMNSDSSSFGFALVGFDFGAGMSSSRISKPTSGPSTSSPAKQCADEFRRKQPMTFFGSELEHCRSGRDETRAGRRETICKPPVRHAQGDEQAQDVGFGIEGVDTAAARRPMPARALAGLRSRADSGGRDN